MSMIAVYVSCAESHEIQVFSLDAVSGKLALIQSMPIEGAPLPLRLSPDKRFLYAGLRADNAIASFAIDPAHGTLSFSDKIAAQGAPTYVACDRTGHWLFCASYGDNNLGIFSLDGQGHFKKLVQTENNLVRAHAALTDHSNEWLLVPMLGMDAIGIYRLQDEKETDDQKISPNSPAMMAALSGSGPRHIVMADSNRDVYCLNELNGTIDYCRFDTRTGALTLTQTLSMMPPDFDGAPWAAELRMTADCRFLYATDRRSSTLAAFSIDREKGSLCLIAHYPTETQPRGMDVDPSGKWLLVSGELSGQMTVYAIDPQNGTLAKTFSCPTGKDPICVEVAFLD